MALEDGFTVAVADRLALYRKIRRALPAALFDLNMQGHRLLVAQDKVDDMARGLIHKPRSTVDAEQQAAGAGWVVAVGPCVGGPGAPHPVGVLCEHPTDLLGKHVYYQQWAGKVFRTDEDDSEFGGKLHLVILTDRDIQAVDDPAPTGLSEAEEAEIYRAAAAQGLLGPQDADAGPSRPPRAA